MEVKTIAGKKQIIVKGVNITEINDNPLTTQLTRIENMLRILLDDRNL